MLIANGIASGIAGGIAAILGATALLHVYWAAGGLWPARSEAELVARVIGASADKMPPRWLTFAVAVLIALAGLWPFVFLGMVSLPVPEWLVTRGMWGLCGIFLLRGAVTYVPGLWQGPDRVPFFRLNRRYFSPLILAIGLGYLVLLRA